MVVFNVARVERLNEKYLIVGTVHGEMPHTSSQPFHGFFLFTLFFFMFLSSFLFFKTTTYFCTLKHFIYRFFCQVSTCLWFAIITEWLFSAVALFIYRTDAFIFDFQNGKKERKKRIKKYSRITVKLYCYVYASCTHNIFAHSSFFFSHSISSFIRDFLFNCILAYSLLACLMMFRFN